MKYRITRLPSGYWCVWYGDDWMNASLPTREAAEKFIQGLAPSAKAEITDCAGGKTPAQL